MLKAFVVIGCLVVTGIVTPYVGRYGWTSIQLSTVDADELGELITEAWRRTAPKKLVAAYDANS